MRTVCIDQYAVSTMIDVETLLSGTKQTKGAKLQLGLIPGGFMATLITGRTAYDLGLLSIDMPAEDMLKLIALGQEVMTAGLNTAHAQEQVEIFVHEHLMPRISAIEVDRKSRTEIVVDFELTGNTRHGFWARKYRYN